MVLVYVWVVWQSSNVDLSPGFIKYLPFINATQADAMDEVQYWPAVPNRSSKVNAALPHVGGRPVNLRGHPGYDQRPGNEIFRSRNLEENSNVGQGSGVLTPDTQKNVFILFLMRSVVVYDQTCYGYVLFMTALPFCYILATVYIPKHKSNVCPSPSPYSYNQYESHRFTEYHHLLHCKCDASL